MRWERLFEDLESQLEAADREAFDAEVADRTRREVALVRITDRLREAVGGSIELTVCGADALGGVIRRVGPDWLLLDDGAERDVVIASAAVLTVRHLPAPIAGPASRGTVQSRLTLGHALRGVARDRAAVTVVLRDGARLDGTIDRVGADFVDLAEHPAGEPRRPAQLRGIRTVSFTGLSVIRAGAG